MKLYHYTNLKTLALILKHRTLRFNRLDKVDDLEENVKSNGLNLGQYIFVSCWTEDAEESIPLWRMYAGIENGVRICLDEDMFQTYDICNFKFRDKVPIIGSLSLIPQKDIENQDYFIMPLGTNNRTSFLKKVEYVPDIHKYTDNVAQFQLKEKKKIDAIINFGEIGKYKNTKWAFQKESRFIINIMPCNPLYYVNNPNLMVNIVYNAYKSNKALNFSFYDMRLKNDILNKIEITLSPEVSESQRIIVEALCRQFAPEAKISDSALFGKVRLK
ncbi:hypothetical protein LPYR103PRE_03270 [Segatella asaccharophila]